MCSHFSPKMSTTTILLLLHPPHIFPDMIKHFLSKSGGSGSNHSDKEEKKDWKVRTTSTITTDVRRWSSANVVAIVRNCPYYCRIQNDEEVLVLPPLNAGFPMMPFFHRKRKRPNTTSTDIVNSVVLVLLQLKQMLLKNQATAILLPMLMMLNMHIEWVAPRIGFELFCCSFCSLGFCHTISGTKPNSECECFNVFFLNSSTIRRWW